MGSELVLWLARAVLIILLFLFLLAIISIIRADLRGKKETMQPPAENKIKLPSRMTVKMATGESNVGEVALVGHITIGRSNDNQIILRELTISSHHAVITCGHDKIVVEDLRSTNGVLLNGIRIMDTAELCIGDELQIGETVFAIE
ncbi:MAG: FHA domain-containing protein [bacterium]